MKKYISFALAALAASVGYCAPSVGYKAATNIAHAVVATDVADWAMAGQPKPQYGSGLGTNDVQGLVDSSFNGGTNAVNTALGSYINAETATNAARAVVTEDVSDWAKKNSEKPTLTNDVMAVVDASFNGGTNAVNTALGSYINAETATNAAKAVVTSDVADWALAGKDKPKGIGTNEVQGVVDASFNGGTNAVNVALGSYVTSSVTNGLADTNFVTEAAWNYSYAKKPRKIGNYLWEFTAENEDFDKAMARMAVAYPSFGGGCSGLSTSRFHARNYDWYFDKSCVFVVRSNYQETQDGKPKHFASIGISTGLKTLTEDVVQSGKWVDSYYALPFAYVDGMNEHGVAIQCNVVPSNSTKTATWRTKRDGCVIAFAIIRYALDRASTALEAANIINTNIFVPAEFKYDPHYLVSDSRNSYIVEDCQIIDNDTTDETLTNFRIKNADVYDLSTIEPYGMGVERYRLMQYAGADRTTIDGIFAIMKSVWYTKAYDTTVTPFWLTEYTGTKEETGYEGLTVQNTETAPSNFDAYKAKLIAEYTTERDSSNAATYRQGKSWQTVHTSIYDRNNLSMTLYTQEDSTRKNVFLLNNDGDRVTSVNGSVGDVTVLTYTPFKSGWHNSDSTMNQLCEDLSNDSDVKQGMVFLGELSNMTPMPDNRLGNFECIIKVCEDGVFTFEGTSLDTTPYHWEGTGGYEFNGWRCVLNATNPTADGDYIFGMNMSDNGVSKTYGWQSFSTNNFASKQDIISATNNLQSKITAVGILKGDGTAVTAATADTDYAKTKISDDSGNSISADGTMTFPLKYQNVSNTYFRVEWNDSVTNLTYHIRADGFMWSLSDHDMNHTISYAPPREITYITYKVGNSWFTTSTIPSNLKDGNVHELELTDNTGGTNLLFKFQFLDSNPSYTSSKVATTNNVIEIVSNMLQRATYSAMATNADTTVTSVVFDSNVGVKYYTGLTASTYSIGFSADGAANLDDGVYDWNMVLSSSEDITQMTFSNAEYVGSDKTSNPNHAYARIDSGRTAHVFKVRLIKVGTTYKWLVAYEYSFAG